MKKGWGNQKRVILEIYFQYPHFSGEMVWLKRQIRNILPN